MVLTALVISPIPGMAAGDERPAPGQARRRAAKLELGVGVARLDHLPAPVRRRSASLIPVTAIRI
jgi:hypothetical protein